MFLFELVINIAGLNGKSMEIIIALLLLLGVSLIMGETGLKISGILYYVSSFDYLSSKGKKTRQFNFLVKVVDGEVKLSEEHEKFAFVKQDDLGAYNITLDVKEAIESALNPQ